MSKGVTLLEAVVAIAIWMVFSAGLFFFWQHVAAGSAGLVNQQNAFENARIAMDGLVTNIQLANEVELVTHPGDVLRTLTLRQLNPRGNLHSYVFRFNHLVVDGSPNQHRLLLGNNEFARGVKMIYITHVAGSHMDITIETPCDPPLVLKGSVDVRYKKVVAE